MRSHRSSVIVASLLLLAGAAVASAQRGLAPDDLYRLKSVSDPALSPDGKRVAFVVGAIDRPNNRRTSAIWIASTGAAPAPRPLVTAYSPRSPRWSPDGRLLAFLSARPDPDQPSPAATPRAQLFVLSLDEAGEPRRLTALAEGVEAYSWAPDGRRIALVSRVAQPPTSGRPAAERSDVRHYRASSYKADGAGYDDGRRGQLFVLDVAGGAVTQLTREANRTVSGEADWSPDGSRIAYVAQRTDTDVEESADAWVVPASGGAAVKVSDTGFRVGRPRWSPDGRKIAYVGAADWEAIPKIRVVAAEGGRSEIVSGDLTFMTEITWSADGRAIWAETPVAGEEHLMRVEVATGRATRVTSGARTHRGVEINEKAGLMTYLAGDLQHPDEVHVAAIDGSAERRISRANDDLIAGLELPAVERLSYPSADGWEVDGFLVKPVGWQAGRSYPLILCIHGGPNGMFGVGWNADFQNFAAAGYAVFYTNPRGSSGYGERFQRGVAGEWGGKAYDDIMAGVAAITARHAWIDRGRLGVTGHSYGGFMTDWIVGRTTLFKAAVSISGISDFVSVEGTRDGFYGHAKDFGGDLFESFETYWKYSPLRNAGQVKTPVLILHGEADHRVPLLQGEEFFRALRHFGVTSELVIFPREPHTPRREPRHHVELVEWSLYWFDRFLLGREAAVRPNER